MHDEVWVQPLDYEHIPFQCRRCHEHGHLFRQCPLSININEQGQKEKEKDDEGFEKVSQRRKTTPKNLIKEDQSHPTVKNRYKVLQEEDEENEQIVRQEEPKGRTKNKEQEIEGPSGEEPKVQKERIKGGSNREDMDLGELDLEGIEKACENLKEGYIPFQQLVLFKEALIKTKGARGLGVVSESMKGGEEKRRGRRTNAQRIQDVGGRLMASGQYPTINDVFDSSPKCNT